MRLISFQVQGYKNLHRPVSLTELGPLNVIHGINNSGKSNLLESIGLFFATLDRLFATTSENAYDRHRPASATGGDKETPAAEAPADAIAARTLRSDTLRALGFPIEEIFSFGTPAPIAITGELAFRPEEIAAIAPSAPEFRTASLTIQIVLQGVGARALLTHASLDTRPLERDDPFLRELILYMGRRRAEGLEGAEGAGSRTSFELLKVDRGLSYKSPSLDTPDERGPRALIPSDLCMALYDAKEAHDVRWERFTKALAEFTDLLPGRPEMSFKRRANRADIVFAQPLRKPIPSHLLGAGVQQIINLLGRLVMTDAVLLAIEEPELNINYSLQRRLLPALRTLLGNDVGPQQLFLTSHSNAFEEPGDTFFYGLVVHPDGTEVQRRPASEAALFTGQLPVALPAAKRAPLSYVTREGLVRLPDDVLQKMSLQQGGGIFFADDQRTGYTWVLNDQQFLSLFNQEPDEKHGKV